jgi:hypothetical protein
VRCRSRSAGVALAGAAARWFTSPKPSSASSRASIGGLRVSVVPGLTTDGASIGAAGSF